MEAFFLQAPGGSRFCVYHPPRRGDGESGDAPGFVFVPAFAEEMNKARHVVSQTARRLAGLGIGVLLIDLAGCGDSSGSMRDATWDDWRADIALGQHFLRTRGHRRVSLWGMRLGATLAAQCARDAAAAGQAVERCVLWQPVLNGEAHLNQFLRLRMANAMLSGEAAERAGESSKSLRARLAAGEVLEVAGYDLAPALAAAIEHAVLDEAAPPCPMDWFEVLPEADRPLPPAASRVSASWRQQPLPCTLTCVVGEPFWAATHAAELIQCEPLVEATAAAAPQWR